MKTGECIYGNQLAKDNILIAFAALGEGLGGDYNEGDQDDVELLRLNVSRWNEEEEDYVMLHDGSLCTLMPVDTPDDILQAALEKVALEIDGHIDNGSYKHILERLSFMEPHWFKKEGKAET